MWCKYSWMVSRECKGTNDFFMGVWKRGDKIYPPAGWMPKIYIIVMKGSLLCKQMHQ